MAILSYRDLEVWQKAHQLVLDIYKVTRDFPSEEKFGLVSQIRRAAVSVAANIVEGFGRATAKDKVHFYNISQTSLREVHYYLLLATDMGWIRDDDSMWLKRCERIAMMLTKFSRSAKSKVVG